MKVSYQLYLVFQSVLNFNCKINIIIEHQTYPIIKDRSVNPSYICLNITYLVFKLFFFLSNSVIYQSLSSSPGRSLPFLLLSPPPQHLGFTAATLRRNRRLQRQRHCSADASVCCGARCASGSSSSEPRLLRCSLCAR